MQKPLQDVGEAMAKPDPRKDVMSHNTIFYQKEDFLKWQTQSLVPDAPVKIGAPGGYYGPTPKHLPNPNKYEKPFDCVQTLVARNIPENVDGPLIRRELAKEGVVVLDGQFSHNLITNDVKGEGKLHVRTKNNKDMDKVLRNLKGKGMDVQVLDDYRPVWSLY